MIYDHNLSWGRWPFRDFLCGSFGDMAAALEAAGIGGGLVRSAETHFNADLYACNERLKAAVSGPFTAVPTVHPDYGLWREERAPAVAVNSAFHSYSLTDSEALEMIGFFAGRGTALVIPVREEDERSQHRRCLVPAVPAEEIAVVAERFPELDIIVLNGFANELAKLAYPRVYYDFAFVESFDTLHSLAGKLDMERLIFGSHAPFFYPGGALSKINQDTRTGRIVR